MLRLLMIAAVMAAGGAWAQDAQPAGKCGPLPAAIENVKIYAIDGDTLAVVGIRIQARLPNIRLWGIQAPELRNRSTGEETWAGMRSRVALDAITQRDGDVKCTPIEWDRYCRVVAPCTVGGADIGHAMLLGGWAYVYTTYAFGRGRDVEAVVYQGFETTAREARRGLWARWLAP